MPEVVPEDVEDGIEADEEHDMLYGAEDGQWLSATPKSGVPPGNAELEPEVKRRKLANICRSKSRFATMLRLQKYDGSIQKRTKMLDQEFGKNGDNNEEVTSIIEKLTDCKDMPTLHVEEEKWADMMSMA